jgi:hypothetical protein
VKKSKSERVETAEKAKELLNKHPLRDSFLVRRVRSPAFSEKPGFFSATNS